MVNILNIETSTSVCSLALATDGVVVAVKESNTKNTHAESVTTFSQEILTVSGIGFDQLDAIAVSKGPGSYTGLRIGVSTAKGFCYALDKPLIAVNTLKSLALGMIGEIKERGFNTSEYLYCPMIDARRMEVYTALYDDQLNEIEQTSALVLENDSFRELLSQKKVVFAGDGSEKCKSLFAGHSNAFFLYEFLPSARYLSPLSYQNYQNSLFENVAYFEPFYLKDFIAALPKVKGLR